MTKTKRSAAAPILSISSTKTTATSFDDCIWTTTTVQSISMQHHKNRKPIARLASLSASDMKLSWKWTGFSCIVFCIVLLCLCQNLIWNWTKIMPKLQHYNRLFIALSLWHHFDQRVDCHHNNPCFAWKIRVKQEQKWFFDTCSFHRNCNLQNKTKLPIGALKGSSLLAKDGTFGF